MPIPGGAIQTSVRAPLVTSVLASAPQEHDCHDCDGDCADGDKDNPKNRRSRHTCERSLPPKMGHEGTYVRYSLPPPQVWESALRRRQTEPSRLGMSTCSPKQRRVRRQRVRKTRRNPGERVRSPGSGVFPHSYSCSRSACGHGNVPETATGGASACSGRLQARSWCNGHLAWCSVFRSCIR